MPRNRKPSKSKKVKPKLYIFCEGEKDRSESAYFKSLIKDVRQKGELVEIIVKDTKYNTGKELVKAAKRQLKKSPKNDIAWIIYDKDGYTEHPATFDMAKANKIRIGFSSISFVYWLLLHFTYTSKCHRKSDEIISILKHNYLKNYSKKCINVYKDTKERIAQAIENSVKIRKHHKRASIGIPVYDLNPYTNLDELVEEIKLFGK